MADLINSGNKKDKWTKKVTDWINWLNEKKQAKLVAGDNVTLTPQQDGTVEISAGGGTVALDDLTDVDVSSVTDGQALVYDAQNQEWIAGEAGQVDDVVMNGGSIVQNKVASFKNYVEITQSQYDALPSSKLTDGVLYCIKDDGYDSGEKFAPIIYSTAEREIGVWFDGKPLYEKSGIIPYSAFTTEGVQKVVSIASQLGLSNIDIKYYEGELRSSIYGRSLLGARTYNTNQSVSQDLSNWYGESSFYYGQVALRMYNDATTLFDRWSPDLQITVRYTKNDDVAGSGTYGTDGVPMVHYSNDEHVIGTWTDGKTLYEKTVHINSLPSTAYTSVSYPHNIANIDQICGYDIIARFASGAAVQIPRLALYNGTTWSGSANSSLGVDSISKTNITLLTGSDRSAMNADVTIRYTKTT